MYFLVFTNLFLLETEFLVYFVSSFFPQNFNFEIIWKPIRKMQMSHQGKVFTPTYLVQDLQKNGVKAGGFFDILKSCGLLIWATKIQGNNGWVMMLVG